MEEIMKVWQVVPYSSLKGEKFKLLGSCNYLQINLIIKMKHETRKGMYTIFG